MRINFPGRPIFIQLPPGYPTRVAKVGHCRHQEYMGHMGHCPYYGGPTKALDFADVPRRLVRGGGGTEGSKPMFDVLYLLTTN